MPIQECRSTNPGFTIHKNKCIVIVQVVIALAYTMYMILESYYGRADIIP